MDTTRANTPQKISASPYTKGQPDAGRGFGREFLHALEELDNREAEADQRNCGAYPRKQCAFQAGARAQPGEMTIRCYPHFEPATNWTGARQSVPRWRGFGPRRIAHPVLFPKHGAATTRSSI